MTTADRMNTLKQVLKDAEAVFTASDFTLSAAHHVYWAAKSRRLDPRDASGFREEAFERALDELAEVLAHVILAADELESNIDDLLERAITGWEYRSERRPS